MAPLTPPLTLMLQAGAGRETEAEREQAGRYFLSFVTFSFVLTWQEENKTDSY